MKFKDGILVKREIEIGTHLLEGKSIHNISVETGLKKKILTAHVKNMMKKLKTTNKSELMKKLLEII